MASFPSTFKFFNKCFVHILRVLLEASFSLQDPKWGILPTKALIRTQVDPTSNTIYTTKLLDLQIRLLEPHTRARRNGESGIHLEAFLRKI